MSSIQERLQLKRVPLDTWNIREQLCLASAVVRSGDQNWMSVSRALKTVGEPNRPQDWYSQKSCAAQYGALLEHVETPKRKKRSSEGAVETPQESILKKLTQERIVEIQKTLAEMNQQYDQLKDELLEVHNPSTSDDRIKELWTGMESRARARERDAARRAAWMKERDERRSRADRTWRPQGQAMAVISNPVASPAPPSSPLLTSLLKSSPVVTTPQHIPHPAGVVDTMSPSVTAPTLSMLLEKCAPGTQHDNKHAAIEHIKSQLVQIEHQLKANNPTPVPLPPPATPAEATPALDIDDIEIKAEDVYAFQDIDLHIPPVTTMHKPNTRVPEKPAKKEEDEGPEVGGSEAEPVPEEVLKDDVEQMDVDVSLEEVAAADVTETRPQEQPEVQQEAPEPPQEAEVKIAFPDVKFPTTEIKVIQSDEQKIKEEIKEVDIPAQDTTPEPETDLPAPEVVENPQPVVQEPAQEQPVVSEVEVRPDPEPQHPAPPPEEPQETAVEEIPLPVVDTANIPLPLGAAPEAPAIVTTVEEPRVEEAPSIKEEEAPPPEPEVSIEQKLEMMEKGMLETPPEVVPLKVEEDLKREEDSEDSIPLKEMLIKEETAQAEAETKAEMPKPEEPSAERPSDERTKPERAHTEPEDTHTETDDDTPMELSREEEKDGKKKRDYSRKKKSDSRTWSGSESAAEASAPESPSASDAERHHRLWRKSVMLVYSRLCAHKYASLFLRPITDEEAPGYSRVVRRPMDLTTIRRHIDAGLIRTTAEFQRDVLLMLTNALMYNSSEHSVYSMAKEMHKEAQCQLGMLVAAQAHAALVDAAPATRKRRRHDEAPHGRHH